MHRVSVCIAETNTYIRTCTVTLLHYYVVHIPVPAPLACCGLLFDLITANTHHPHPHCPTLRHLQESVSLWGEHTGRLCAAPVCGNHAGLTGGGGRRYSDSAERVQHVGMPYTNLNTYCSHKSTLISHQPLPHTQLTWGNSTGRRPHREVACCPSRWTLCRVRGSREDGCSEGEQNNTPQTLADTENWWQHGKTP